MKKKLPKLIVILGPTASGKTDLAIKLAKGFDAEIVSADSRQIYKELNIGTAKPKKKELKAVPHHLIDVVKPDQEFNAAIYKKMAIKAIKDIQKRGKIPFLVGGTGLYIQAVADNTMFPKVIPQLRLRKKLESKTTEELFRIYKKMDSKGAKLIDRCNKRRLVRAIEVCKTTGKPFWQQRKRGEPAFESLQIGIKLSKKALEQKIRKRVSIMLRQGLEKEAKILIKKYGKSPPLQTIGYQEWIANENTSQIKKGIILHTLQFAKRQMTWFKRDERICWVSSYREAKKLIKEFLTKI